MASFHSMEELPSGWRVTKLGAVASVDWGNTSLTKSNYTASGFPAFSASGHDGFMKSFEHEGRAIIVSAIGARCGKCFLADGRWTAIKNTIVIKPTTDLIDLDFLYFFVNDETYWTRTGSGQPFIAIGRAREHSVILPPIHEQRAIGHVLRTVQLAKVHTDRVIAAAHQLKASLMRHLLNYGPVSISEASEVEVCETDIGWLPSHWQVQPLSTVATVKTSTASTKAVSAATTSSSDSAIVHFVKVADMNLTGNERRFTHSNVMMNVEKRITTKLNAVPSQATVLPKRGAAIATNKKRMTTTYTLLDPNLMAVIPSAGLVPEYLFAWFETFDLRSITDTTTLPQLNKKDIEPLPFPVPPLNEQRAIADMLSTVQAKVSTEHSRSAALHGLFESLLDNLMTGKQRMVGFDVKGSTEKRKRSSLADIFGKWPGDETDEQVRKALEEMD